MEVEPIGDDELAELAMAADPDEPPDPHAVPWSGAAQAPGLLPAWYMPPTVAVRGRRRRLVVGVLIVSLLVGSGAGLCVTYGFPEIAW